MVRKMNPELLTGDGQAKEGANGNIPDLKPLLAPGSQWLTTPRSILGSLPLDLKVSSKSSELVPAVVFAPPHLRAAQSLFLPAASDVTGNADGNSGKVSVGVATMSTDQEFLQQAEAMLSGGDPDGLQSRFRAGPTNASYDFDEYIFLRNTDEPIARDLMIGPGTAQGIPSDPRFRRFVNAAENGIAMFLDNVRLPLGDSPQLGVLVTGLQRTLHSWWHTVCAIRAFNRFNRYSRSEIKKHLSELGWQDLTPEAYYGSALYYRLFSNALEEARAYLVGGGDSATLGKLLTVAYWEDVLTSVFKRYFDDRNINPVDPSVPRGEYPFDPFPADEVLFGLRVGHRQTWRLLGYARGDLVKSIPLGPRESQKVSLKIMRRRKMARTAEEAAAFETTSETNTTTKDTSEVVQEASEQFNRHAEAEVSGGYLEFVKGKISGGLSQDLGSSSKQTKSRLNEVMEKTASRMKRDTKVTMSTEHEESFEETRASELVNPNDEIAVTYLYHRLQQRYWVSTELVETHSVVFVPEPLPDWEEISDEWVRQHGDIIMGALLDASFGPVLAAIRKEPEELDYLPAKVFGDAAQAGINAVSAYKDFTGGGDMPDLLASGQQFYERDFERRNSLAMDRARRKHQSEALLTHIRRNILHYMRAIWADEDYEQRMQRYSRIRVPVEWYFVQQTPPSPGSDPTLPLEVEGMFMPHSGSARPLTEVIDPIGPIGYLFNCAIFRLRDDPKLVNLHRALAFLRAAYMRFAVTVTVSGGAGVTLRQTVAYAPRSFLAEYTFTYRTNRAAWLIPVPDRNEGDWFVVRVLPDGSLDALGLRFWLDGTPNDGATLTIRVRAMGELEDPHLRLMQILHPLPAADEEPQVFTDNLLGEMIAVLPELADGDQSPLAWASLSEADKAKFRESYHRFLMLRESGRLVSLDTANVVLDLEISRSPALEPFKRLHRYVDVMKEYQELRRRALDNARREELLKKGILGDPDIEHVTLVGARDDIKDVIAVTDSRDE